MKSIVSFFAVKGFLTDINAPAEIMACLEDVYAELADRIADQEGRITNDSIMKYMHEQDVKAEKRMNKNARPNTPALDRYCSEHRLDFSGDNVDVKD